MAKTAADGGTADSSVADQLRALGVRGVLVKMAERGQLLALRCEIPQCYQGRSPSPRYEPLDRRHGAQGLRVVGLARETEVALRRDQQRTRS
jgi:hypothetical protein